MSKIQGLVKDREQDESSLFLTQLRSEAIPKIETELDLDFF